MRDLGVQTELLGPDDGDHAAGMTIGAVCDSLRPEFPDLSISKLRYLEDQELVTPRRTNGGYRLYGPRDVERLRTILSMALFVVLAMHASGGLSSGLGLLLPLNCEVLVLKDPPLKDPPLKESVMRSFIFSFRPSTRASRRSI